MDTAAAAARLADALGRAPALAIVLGSGLGALAEELTAPVAVPFERVGLPPASVAGHRGRWLVGTLGGVPVLLQAGRYHAYEGHPFELVVAPVRILSRLGVRALVLTNAAGAIDPILVPGDLVLLDDHVNLMFRSPLAGPVQGREERFPDMTAPYDAELQRLALDAAGAEGVALRRGVYAAVLGPQYETAAEIRMLARLGAHVVGMSTVPEVVTARALGLRCLAFSTITNKATGLSQERLSHADVLRIGTEAGGRLGRVLARLTPSVRSTLLSARSD